MSSVRDFGAQGDGRHDDTQAFQHAIANGEGLLEIPPGDYAIGATLEIDLGQRRWLGLAGPAGAARIIMHGPGPAIRLVGHHGGTAEPTDFKPAIWRHERMPQLTGLEFVGAHAEADGIEMRQTMQCTLQGLLLRQLRHGVRLVERNRNFLMHGCHIYDNRGVGLWFDRCNLHQAIISACHISYNRQAGVYSLGGDVHNIQFTGNDIEYNYDKEGRISECSEMWFDAREGVCSEVTIASSTIQSRPSYEGVNLRISGDADRSAHLITIVGNVLGSQETSLLIERGERITVTGNTIYDGKVQGVAIRDSRDINLSGNTHGWSLGPQRGMADGIRVERSQRVVISGATLPDISGGEQNTAVSLHHSADCAISNCIITEPPGRGIVLDSSSQCRITNNTLSTSSPRESPAITASGDCQRNLITGNLITGPFAKAVDVQPSHGHADSNIVFDTPATEVKSP